MTNRLLTYRIQGMDGLYEDDSIQLEPRPIIVKFRLTDKTNEGFRKRLDKLKELLVGSQHRLYFTDEPNEYYRATLQSLDVPEEESNDLICHLNFICNDPYKYSPEERIKVDESIEIESPAGAIPIFNIEFTENTGEFMIRHKKKRRQLTVRYNFIVKDKLTLNNMT